LGAYHRKFAIETRSLSCEQAADSVAQYFFFPETKGIHQFDSRSLDSFVPMLTHSIGLALEDVDKLFAPEGIMDAMRDQKVPDVETFEVRRDT
jgi:hypothetical protein